MSDFRVARRYALALFELAQEQKQLDPVLKDIKALKTLLEGSEDFRDFIRNPVLTSDELKGLLKAVFESRLQPVVFTFLLFLVEKLRLNILQDILTAFIERHLEYTNTVRVEIRSEREISAVIKDKLLAKLKERSGKNVQPEYVVDPQLLGGFKIKMNDQVFDASFAAQLQSYHNDVLLTI